MTLRASRSSVLTFCSGHLIPDGILGLGTDEREAQQLLAAGLTRLGLDIVDLPALKKGDDRKKAIAWTIRKKMSVRNEWIVQQLHMGRASNLARYVKEVDEAREGKLRELREMM